MIYVLITFLLIIIELVYFAVAKKFNIIDHPNYRSSHKKIVLRGGGIIFIFGIWIYTLFFEFSYPWFLTGLSLIGLISFIDDIHSLPGKIRLIAQFISVTLMFFELEMINIVNWWVLIIALVIGVGIINAYNFMDGINGITAGYSLSVLSPLIYLNNQFSFISMPFLYIIGLSLLVFCVFNFRSRAICFAGDVGSVSIAFIILFIIGLLTTTTFDFAYITLLVVYGIDSILTIIHRICLHENLGDAHRKHLYQIMANELGIPHLVVASLYMGLQLLISAGLIFLPINHYVYLGIVVSVLSIGYIVFMKKYYHLHENYLKSKAC